MGFFSYLKTADNAFSRASVTLLTNITRTTLDPVGNPGFSPAYQTSEPFYYPAVNAVRLPASRPARTWRVTGEGFLIDLNGPATVSYFAIIGHNLTREATVVLRGGSGTNPDGSQFQITIPWRDNLMPIRITPPQTWKNWSLILSDAENMDGFVQVGYLLAGQAVTFPFNFNYGWDYGEDFLNTRGESQWGRRFAYKGVRMARVRVDFDPIKQVEATQLLQLVRSLDGDGTPMLWIPDIERAEAVFGRVISNINETRRERVATGFEFEEENTGKYIPRPQPFVWTQGESITALGGVFSRSIGSGVATTCYETDSRGFLFIRDNVIRDDHFATPVDKTLLIERSGINNILWAEDFTQASWSKAGVTVQPNVVYAPNGYPAADQLVEDTATTQHTVYQNTPWVTVGHTIAFSFFVRMNGARYWIAVYNAADSVGHLSWINVVNRQVGVKDPAHTIKLREHADGWLRVTVITYAGSTTPIPYFQVLLATGDGPSGATYNYVGDGSSAMQLWGFQGETGTFTGTILDASTYMPTEGTVRSRYADTLWFPLLDGDWGAYTLYLRFVEKRANTGHNTGILGIGKPDDQFPRFWIDMYPSQVYRFVYYNVFGAVTYSNTPTPTQFDDLVELRMTMNDNAQLQPFITLNGGLETVCPLGPSAGSVTTWTGARLQVGSHSMANPPPYTFGSAFEAIKIVRGIQSLETMRKY